MEQQALEQNCVERSGVGSWMNGQGTWIPLPSGVGIGSALKDGCGDVGASLVRESPQLVTWIQSPSDVERIFGQRQPAVGRLLLAIVC